MGARLAKSIFMEELIRRIILRDIPAGCIFDAHTVIEIMIHRHSDEYLSFYLVGETTKHFHSRISKAIDSIDNDIIERQDADSHSINIHQNYSPNKCWRKY